MDWENRFSSIVRETEKNIAKVKQHLSVTVPLKRDSRISPPKGNLKASRSKNKHFTNPLAVKGVSLHQKRSAPVVHFDLDDAIEDQSQNMMNVTTGIQALNMQEQIDAQQKTIESLKQLVQSLDSEREFYKTELTSLKDEVDTLTSTMKYQPSGASEVSVSNVKRELTREMNRIKSMVHRFGKDSARSTTSPKVDAQVWTIKENLATNLNQVRDELNSMNGRIDRMENKLANEGQLSRYSSRSKTGLAYQTPSVVNHQNTTRHNHYSDPILNKPLFTPTSKVKPTVSDVELIKLRSAITSINSKIDHIERNFEEESNILEVGNIRPSKTAISDFNSVVANLSRPFDNATYSLDGDLSSLSEPSNLTDLSDNEEDEENNTDDDDDEDDLFGFKFDSNPFKSSISKQKYQIKKKSELSLSDSDLSDDIEDIVAVDLEDLDLDSS